MRNVTESVEETVFWLSQPDIARSIADAATEYDAGETTGGEDLRAAFGLPPLQSGR
jgi:antitoxin YefM